MSRPRFTAKLRYTSLATTLPPLGKQTWLYARLSGLTLFYSYYNKATTVARWTVREAPKKRKAKNVLFFIGDGMTISMQSAARLLAHKSVNGKYQSLLQMDQVRLYPSCPPSAVLNFSS